MKKERLEAYFDDVLSIICTILVLTLAAPKGDSIQDVWELRESYLVYALSFFWIIAMWINLYRQWHDVKRISNRVLWTGAMVLFFTSLVPYLTSYAGDHFYSPVAQSLYALDIFFVTLSRYFMNIEIMRANKASEEIQETYTSICRGIRYDLLAKLFGLFITLFIWPPFSMILIITSSIYLTILIAREERKYLAHHPSDRPDEE